MKKTACLFLALALILSSCSLLNPIDKFKAKMFAAKSYTVTLSIEDIPVVGTVRVEYKKDGDKTYLSTPLAGDVYTVTEDGKHYTYTKNLLGVWSREADDGDDGFSEYIDEDTIKTLFDSGNYTKNEDGSYEYTGEEEIKNMKNITASFEDDVCTFNVTYTYSGFDVDCKIKFFDIGNTDVELPNA